MPEKDKTQKRLKKKSNAKALGLKSSLRLDDGSTAFTSFGKGAEAVPESRAVDNNIKPLSRDTTLEIHPEDKTVYKVNNKRIKDLSANVDKIRGKSGMDILGFKPILEKQVFGKTFDDSIHIQIAYAAYDIQKSLAAIVPNLIYTLNHLDRGSGEDIIGFDLPYKVSYKAFEREKRENFKKYYENANKHFRYYRDVLCDLKNISKDGKKKYRFIPKDDKKIYNILSAVSMLRQNLVHYRDNPEKSDVFSFILLSEDYNRVMGNSLLHITSTLDNIYKKSLDEVTRNFKNKEGNNAALIKKIVTEWDEKKIISELYNFTIIKTEKNLGFSLKKIRESALEEYHIPRKMRVQEWSAVRRKYNKLFDFIVYLYLKDGGLSVNGQSFADRITFELRSLTAEDDEALEEKKGSVYLKYAREVMEDDDLRGYINEILRILSDSRNFKEKLKLNDSDYEEVSVENNASDFSKLVFLVTKFLDGKEINILLTSLISKFQDIDSFNNLLDDLNEMGLAEKAAYTDKYKLLERSGEIARELNLVKSIARMDLGLDNLNLTNMYKDALMSLGVKSGDVDDVFERYFNDKKNLSAYIRNNILENNRFKYIIKYLSPETVPAITGNKNIVKFVLGRMPEAQIKKYYDNVIKGNDSFRGELSKNKMLNELVDYISDTSFDSIKDDDNLYGVKNRKDMSEQRVLEREKKKALLSLYYTVVYIFVKQMIKINSLYFTAFFYFERDSKFKGIKEGKNKEGKYLGLTRHYLSEKLVDYITKAEDRSWLRNFDEVWEKFKSTSKIKKRDDAYNLAKYIAPKGEDAVESLCESLIRPYRNDIAHLTVLSVMCKYIPDIKNEIKSYFECYHYFIQRDIYDTKKKNGSYPAREAFEKPSLKFLIPDMKFDGTDKKMYSKRLLRALNLPFGYNVARYKNLTYEKLYLSYDINE